MNAMARNLIVKFGVTVLTNILQDIIDAEFIKNARMKLINLGIELTGKTPYSWDDDAWRRFTEMILTPENWITYGSEIIDWCIEHVEDSDTKWDDTVFLPILQDIKDAMDETTVIG